MWYHTFYRKFIWKQRKEPYNYLKSANFITMIIITHENKGGWGSSRSVRIAWDRGGAEKAQNCMMVFVQPLKSIAEFRTACDIQDNIFDSKYYLRFSSCTNFFIILFTLMLHYGDKCVTKSSEHPDLLFQILKFKRWFVFGHLLYIMCEPIVISFIFFYAKILCVLWLYAYFGLVNP